MERTNIRYVTEEQLGEQADFASIDVSFISINKIMPAVLSLIKESGEVVSLIKPQFEAGREKVGKKGVVREKSTHIEVINKIVENLIKENINILDLSFSPIKGPEGNMEFLIDLSRETNFKMQMIDEVVNKAHESL